jgi:hypothetical protein
MGEILMLERETFFSRVLTGFGVGAAYPSAISGGENCTCELALLGAGIKLRLTPTKTKLKPIATISFLIIKASRNLS